MPVRSCQNRVVAAPPSHPVTSHPGPPLLESRASPAVEPASARVSGDTRSTAVANVGSPGARTETWSEAGGQFQILGAFEAIQAPRALPGNADIIELGTTAVWS